MCCEFYECLEGITLKEFSTQRYLCYYEVSGIAWGE